MSNNLFRSNSLELLWGVYKVIGISLWGECSRIRLLDEVFISLLLGERNGVLFGLEIYVCALHEVGGGLPSHQGILPPMPFWENIPVHPPAATPPRAGLGGWLGFLEDSNSPSLKLHGSARDEGRRENVGLSASCSR